MNYRLIKRKGLKNLTLRYNNRGVTIYAPKRTPQHLIDAFWNQHKDRLPEISERSENQEYHRLRDQAREILLPLVEQWAQVMNLSYNRVTIKDTRSRWGSCSIKRNLNFSYRVAFLPDYIRDYIIIHELSHLVHMNHSAQFWHLVSRYCPQYPQYRRELRDIHAKRVV